MRWSTVERWNRRLHYYLGLFLLGFLWLFAFTGLLLNHPEWTFAEFWPQRAERNAELRIRTPQPGSDLSQARELMGELRLSGEIEWITTRQDPSRLEFRISRPGHLQTVRADLRAGTAQVQTIHLNAWGVMHVLHTFTGVRLGDERNARDWWLTALWAYSMDGVAVALVLEVLSSLLLWWGLRRRKAAALWVLAAGCAVCAYFVFALG